ncbi:DUF4157 domain-containing protein [Mucilaginibacter sp.]|uniref:eCIS core domain-containing protein n=1 Tax=Mucilaginibacter sp. TaxID=1882438 RepID=UPI0025EFE0E8|nr:DUF4157 domain-containing protein [Mucilaginibacter sp.]
MLTTLQKKAKTSSSKGSFRAKKGRTQNWYRYGGKEKPTEGFAGATGFNLGALNKEYTSNASFSQIPVYSNQTIQTKLTVNEPGDKHEQEADNIADKVMRVPGDQQIQRKCSACEEEDKKIQRKPGPGGGITPITKAGGKAGVGVSPAIHNRIAASEGGGSSLDGATNSFMSDRFGVDFGNVKIHDNNEAAQLNRTLNARAFTVGNDIYFNEGEYTPASASGRRLLAHELVHTLQQSSVQNIYREPKVANAAPKPQADPVEMEAVKLEQEIFMLPEIFKLDNESWQTVMRIIKRAKAEPDKRIYYLQKLKLLLTKPFRGKATAKKEYGCSPEVEKKTRPAVDAALKKEKKEWDGLFADVEERVVATSKQADRVTRKGTQNKTFIADASDPNNIRVMIKVKLNGDKDDVIKIKQLEDAIERASHTKGYTLDIVFVDAPGPDVFEFTVNFCQWPNSDNWASGPDTLSHEVHHALGLGDRYSYIEAQAGNQDINLEIRLDLFEEEMNKSAPKDLPNNPNSKMDTNSNPLLNDDVCAVAHDPGPDRDKCIAARDQADRDGF